MQNTDKNKAKKKSHKKSRKNSSSTNLTQIQAFRENKNDNLSPRRKKGRRNSCELRQSIKRLSLVEEDNNEIGKKKQKRKEKKAKNKESYESNELNQISSKDKNIKENAEDNKNNTIKANVPDNIVIEEISYNPYSHNSYSSNLSKRCKCKDCCACYKCRDCSDCCECRDCRDCLLSNIFTIISLVVDVIIILLIIRIYNWTDENPLENIILMDPDIAINSTRIENESIRILNEKVFNEESRHKNVSYLNKGKKYLRHLDDDCEDFNARIKEYNYELDKAFDLEFDKIHKISLGIIITHFINLGILALILIMALFVLCCREKVSSILALIVIISFIIGLFSGIANLILFIIMLVKYYKGYTTGEFLDYYEDCLNDDLKPFLEDAYDKLNKLNTNIIIFVVLNCIGVFLNNLSSCCKRKKDN